MYPHSRGIAMIALTRKQKRLIKRHTDRTIKFFLISILLVSGTIFGSITGTALGKGYSISHTTNLIMLEVKACNKSEDHWLKCYNI
jgi:hypothetical protein